MDMKTLKRMLVYCHPYRYLIGVSLLLALCSVVLTLVLPIMIGNTIDLMIGVNQVNMRKVIYQLGVILVIVLLNALTQWIMTRCTNKVTYQSVRDLRRDFFNKIHSLPLKYIDSKTQGDLINRVINDIDLIGDGLLHGFASLLTGVLSIIGTIGFMVSINASVALVVILLTPISLFVASYIAKKTFSLFRDQLDLRSELSGFVEESMTNLKLIKAFNYEENMKDRYIEINQRMNDNGVKSQFASALINPSTRFVNNLVYMAVGVVGGLMVVNGHFTIGQLSSFLTYATQYTKPFNEISSVIAELQTAVASAQRVFNVIDEENEEDIGKLHRKADEVVGHIVFDDVSFSYQEEKPFIEHLDIDAKPGARIALVGPTGCGKTTIINLLMRFYEVNSGRICVDNKDIVDLTRENLRSHFGMVLQDTWLFKGTIKENIAYGNASASDEEIIEASKLAHAHDFIERLSQGYDTVVEENGGNISEGQRQLLCIARIMVSKPSILILDEATSSIDTRTEKLIQEALNRIMQGRTSFIVAHRLSTIKNADQILVLKDGAIIESGTHISLLEQNGFYHELYYSQFAASE